MSEGLRILNPETRRHASLAHRYLQEKDVFEKYYKQHLSKRLLSGRPLSDEAERSLLIKLKTECGYEFTRKLESMFTDIKTSREMMQDFRSKIAEKAAKVAEKAAASAPEVSAAEAAAAAAGGPSSSTAAVDVASSTGAAAPAVELQVQVLTTGSWPTQATCNCQLPREVERCCEDFRSYYLSTYSGRKLAWQTNMGNADLRVDFGSKRHELNVSTYQMCILMLYNGADSLSYKEIAEATEIPAAELKRSLQSLALIKGKNVLRKEPQASLLSSGGEVGPEGVAFRAGVSAVVVDGRNA